MNCYIHLRLNRNLRYILVFSEWILLLSLTFSCNPSERHKTGGVNKYSEMVKPEIDTSKVIGTLELYRDKRYESLSEALDTETEAVHKLILYDRGLPALPPEIGELTYLASLDVSHNRLTRLPDEISDLHYLQGFYATNNSLTQFPEQILLLPLLTRVDLSDNQINRFPPEIRVMDQLTRLTMDHNLLTSIPIELYALGKLSVLELADNGLSEIPAGISGLGSLKKLDLSGNQLTGLPREITTMSAHLNELSIQGNPIPEEEIRWLIEAMPATQIRY